MPLRPVTLGSACLATPEAKRRELAQLVEGLLAQDADGDPTYYRIGGDVSPATGLDCSGLVVWGARLLGLDLPARGIRVTDEMFRKLERLELGDVGPGDLALYGTGREPDPATHVVVVLGPGPDKGGFRVASMSGGGAWCTSLELAKQRRPVAKLKEFGSQHYRAGGIGFFRLPFPTAT
jgi:cell wall-associated NlpC family hydrolase